MSKKLLPVAQILDLLSGTADQIHAITANLSDSEIRTRVAADEWSISEVFAHMRACADMWGGRRIMAMLAEDHPTIRTMSPLTWIKQTDYLDQEFSTALAEFREQRDELLSLLTPQSNDGRSRSATIIGASKPFDVTVHIEGDALARHDRLHLKQIKSIANLYHGQT